MQQGAPISALIKPIGLCGTQKAQKIAFLVPQSPIGLISSLEAKHLIWVWIMKVKGPKNRVDFIEVLYVVVNAWGATFWNTWEYG